MAASFIAPVSSSLVKTVFGKEVARAGKGALRAGEYNNMGHTDKNI